MGAVMKAAMPRIAGRADGKRVCALVAGGAGVRRPARALQRRRGRAQRPRGRDPARARGPRRLRRVPARQPGHARGRRRRPSRRRRRSSPSWPTWPTRATRSHRARSRRSPARSTPTSRPAAILEDVVWRHRSTKVAPKTVNQKRYVDSIRNNTVTFGIGPAGTGKTFLAVALAAAALTPPRGQPDHPHAPRGRGRRAAGLPARRPDGQGRPVPAPAVRRAQRHARPREGRGLPREGRDRGRAAGVHARPDAQRQLHHPRRGAEHHARADEDVPHAARLQLARWSSPATSPRSTCRATSSRA